jgi:hypothetical protein
VIDEVGKIGKSINPNNLSNILILANLITPYLWARQQESDLFQKGGGGDKQAILVRNTGDGIFKQLRSPGIDSKESIPLAYVAWRAGTTTLFLLGS